MAPATPHSEPSPVPPTTPPASSPSGGTQTRVALVMNGGVSLAVWMGGVTHELDLLCQASRGDRRRVPTGRDAGVLALWRELTDQARSEFLVDIVSGTSAGGLNGLILATALGRRAALPRLRDVWERSAALEQLRGNPSEPSLLSGHAFRKKIEDEVRRIGESDAGVRPPQPVTLFVTATALDGLPRSYTDGFGNHFDVRDHRRLYRFACEKTLRYVKSGDGDRDPEERCDEPGATWRYTPHEVNDFNRHRTDHLATAARATASFPVAFSPISEQCLIDNREIPRLLRNDRASCVIDGGILNNAPFLPVLETITRRPLANKPVRRVLVFVVPTAGRLGREKAGAEQCEDTPWWEVGISGMSYRSEADLRSGTEEVHRRVAGDAKGTQLELFERARLDMRLAGTLMDMAGRALPEYRRNRVRGVLAELRRELADARSVTTLARGPEPASGPIEAILNGDPLWVPRNLAQELSQPWADGWRWGLATCERVLQSLQDNLRDLPRAHIELSHEQRKALARGATQVSGWLTKALAVNAAVRDEVRRRVPAERADALPDEEAAELIQQTFTLMRIPQELGVLVAGAARDYTEALRAAGQGGWQDATGAVQACLAVDVLTRAFASPQAMVESLGPGFDFLRLGPDAMSPLFNEDRFADIGGRKLYGLRFGHFGAFVHAPWRASDFTWGRLDAAHHLLRLFGLPPAERRSWEERLHDAILRAEAPEGEDHRDWMYRHLHQLREPTDNGLLRELKKDRKTSGSAWRSLRRVTRESLRLLPLRPRALLAVRALTKPMRNAAWRAYLRDPRTVRNRVKRAAYATITTLALVVLLLGGVLGWALELIT